MATPCTHSLGGGSGPSPLSCRHPHSRKKDKKDAPAKTLQSEQRPRRKLRRRRRGALGAARLPPRAELLERALATLGVL